jgi:integrase
VTVSAYPSAGRGVDYAPLVPYKQPSAGAAIAHVTAGEDLLRAAAYAAAAKSPSTLRSYRIDLARFHRYCAANGLVPRPATPQTIAAYCANSIADCKLSTLRRRLVAISQDHKRNGLESPTSNQAVREALRGIARDEDVQVRSKTTKKTAMTGELLTKALASFDRSTLAGKRDAAILLLGFAAALRRSEIAALDVRDLVFDERGVIVTIRRSKTDQEGLGAQIDVPRLKNPGLCPVRALQTWIDASGVDEALFRTFGLDGRLKGNRIDGHDVARIIQRRTRRAGMAGDFAGHSLRRGYITTGVRKNVPAPSLMQRTRHRSLAVFQGYVEEASLFMHNPLAEMLG